jgi:hypothetical protein
MSSELLCAACFSPVINFFRCGRGDLSCSCLLCATDGGHETRIVLCWKRNLLEGFIHVVGAPPNLLLFRCKATQNLIKLFVAGNLRCHVWPLTSARSCIWIHRNYSRSFSIVKKTKDNQFWKPAVLRHLTHSCFRPYRLFFQIKVRDVFHLRNVNIVSFAIYLIATCFGHTSIFRQKYFARTYSNDNGSVVSRILVNIMNNYSDRFGW